MKNTRSNDMPIPSNEGQSVTVHSWSMLLCAVMLVLYAMYFASSLIVPILPALISNLSILAGTGNAVSFFFFADEDGAEVVVAA